MTSRIASLARRGARAWLDGLTHQALTTGELRLQIGRGVRGAALRAGGWPRALSAGGLADRRAAELLGQGLSAEAAAAQLAVEDARLAADLLAPVFSRNLGQAGRVSVELPSTLERRDEMVREAHGLWRSIRRRNLLLGIPATPAGISAMEELIAGGISVDATRVFTRQAWRQVAEAQQAGLEANPEPPRRLRELRCTVSFWLSALDDAVDRWLVERPDGRDAALRGKAGPSLARLAYREQQELLGSSRWERLARRGARPPVLAWSTAGGAGTTPGLRWLEELLGIGAVAAVPAATLEAFELRGRPRPSLQAGLPEAEAVLAALEEQGLSLRALGERLQAEGLAQARAEHQRLLDGLERLRSTGEQAWSA